MATRVEWNKITRDILDVFVALRTTVGSALGGRPLVRARLPRAQLLATRAPDRKNLRLLADMEQRKRTLLNNPRNQIR